MSIFKKPGSHDHADGEDHGHDHIDGEDHGHDHDPAEADETPETMGFDGVAAAPGPVDVEDEPGLLERSKHTVEDGTVYATREWGFGVIGFEPSDTRPFEHAPSELLFGLASELRKETAYR